jgi:SAM-dependent methyltransferase
MKTSEERTREFYENTSQEYFKKTVRLDLPILWEMFSHLPLNSLILDIGCGSGRDLHHFSSNGYQVIGLDYSINLLRLAKQFSQQPVVCANLLALPFRNGSFDGVWALGSLLHVFRSQVPSALREVSRVLRPNSFLFTAMKKGSGEGIDHLGRYNVYYQEMEWAHALRANGFTVLNNQVSPHLTATPSLNAQNHEWIVSLAKSA